MPYESIRIPVKIILDNTGAIIVSKVYGLDGTVQLVQKFYESISAAALENFRVAGVPICNWRVPVAERQEH